jgi:hypothetical protein
MIAFYEVLGEGAVLFDGTYDILSMDDLARPEFLPEELSVNWYKFCDVGEGNCVAFDADSIHEDKCNIIDVFHETAGEPGYSEIIAKSFSEFLECALDAGDCLYWLRWRFKGYGDAFDKKGPPKKKPWWKVW